MDRQSSDQAEGEYRPEATSVNRPDTVVFGATEHRVLAPRYEPRTYPFLFLQTTYQAEVEYDKETGILLPQLDSPLECPNKDCRAMPGYDSQAVD
jgi:hypothetical protein